LAYILFIKVTNLLYLFHKKNKFIMF